MSKELARLVRAARARIAWKRGFEAAAAATATILGAGLAAQLATLMVSFTVPVVPVAAGAAAVWLATVVASRLVLRPRASAAAHELDVRCGLKDRLATLLDLAAGRISSGLADVLREDASQAARSVNVRAAIPLRPVRFGRHVAIFAAVMLLWEIVFSGLTLPHTPARRAAMMLQAEGRRIESVAERLARQAASRNLPRSGEVAADLKRVSGGLQSTRTPGRERASAELQQLLERIERSQRALRQEFQSRTRGDAQRGTAPGDPLPADLQAQLPEINAQSQQMRELSRQLAQENATPDDISRIARVLSQMEPSIPERGSADARARVREAQRRLQQGDQKGASQALGSASQDLSSLSQMIEDEQGLGSAQGAVSQSAGRVATGQPVPTEEDQGSGLASARSGVSSAPRDSGQAQQTQDDSAAAQGPGPGSLPGQGQVQDKLGAPTGRLAGQRQREQISGVEGRGGIVPVEMQLRGRTGRATVAVRAIDPVIVRQADEAMQRQRVPATHREIVRNYFLSLSGK
jgi:hypothetical protein